MLKLDLPNRESKPRNSGITMAIDTGLPLSVIEGYMFLCNNYIDYVKIGWGTSIVTQNIEEKIKLYKKYDIPISFGGTLFEIAYLQNRLAEYKAILKEFGIQYIEISDGTINIPLNRKIQFIEEFGKDFKVLSEVGSKDINIVAAPKEWVKEIKLSLDAGAWKVIAEGRESGKAGLYRQSSEIRTGLIKEILDEIPHHKIIFEAPQKSQQVWLVKKFGTNVNLGNIAFKDIISLETLRLGLRSDTLLNFYGEKK